MSSGVVCRVVLMLLLLPKKRKTRNQKIKKPKKSKRRNQKARQIHQEHEPDPNSKSKSKSKFLVPPIQIQPYHPPTSNSQPKVLHIVFQEHKPGQLPNSQFLQPNSPDPTQFLQTSPILQFQTKPILNVIQEHEPGQNPVPLIQSSLVRTRA